MVIVRIYEYYMNIKRPLSKQPIPKHAQRVFKGVIFDVYQWQQKMFDSTTATFEAIKRSDVVNILPVTLSGKIILTKQEQPGEMPFIGAIGGRVSEGEKVKQAALRELHEESGIQGAQLSLLFSCNLTPKIDWASYTFIAKYWKKDSKQNLDSGEKIELIKVTFEQYLKEIILQDNYRDDEIALYLLKAKQDPRKLAKIRKLFLE